MQGRELRREETFFQDYVHRKNLEPERGSLKTTVLLKGTLFRLHVSFPECKAYKRGVQGLVYKV